MNLVLLHVAMSCRVDEVVSKALGSSSCRGGNCAARGRDGSCVSAAALHGAGKALLRDHACPEVGRLLPPRGLRSYRQAVTSWNDLTHSWRIASLNRDIEDSSTFEIHISSPDKPNCHAKVKFQTGAAVVLSYLPSPKLSSQPLRLTLLKRLSVFVTIRYGRKTISRSIQQSGDFDSDVVRFPRHRPVLPVV
ncbi:hypothetical protein AVEN_255063-1 [Araneus ventricosus]|uniref:Uncharacterized protein n=1 Tax=Araneus ventricosus TaxID=182803 RepID=A0A4Y2QFP0_ARAVE|nr:hypothetical protein AVEN_255063-1 [Araneus ventricosus]